MTTNITTTYDGSTKTLTPSSVTLTNASGNGKITMSPSSTTTITAVTSTSCVGTTAPSLTWSEDSSNPGVFVTNDFALPAVDSEYCFQITVTVQGAEPHDPKFKIRNKKRGAADAPDA